LKAGFTPAFFFAMDITPNHWIFALFFIVAFIGILVWSFKKDRSINAKQYGNVTWVAILVGGGILLLIILKFILRNLYP
jgi:cytochrome b561